MKRGYQVQYVTGVHDEGLKPRLWGCGGTITDNEYR
jgi:hypothetical protein